MASLKKRKTGAGKNQEAAAPPHSRLARLLPLPNPPRGKEITPGTRKCARPSFTCARRQVCLIREVTVGAVFLTVGLRGVVFP